MRMLFGLVGLLITVAIVMFLMVGPLGTGNEGYLKTVARARKDKTTQVQQFSGKTSTGERVNSFVTFVETPEDRFRVAGFNGNGGPLATDYGLQVGDVIVRVGPQDVGGFIINSEETLRDFLDDAFARQMEIVVERPEVGEVELRNTNPGGGSPNPLGGLNGIGGF